MLAGEVGDRLAQFAQRLRARASPSSGIAAYRPPRSCRRAGPRRLGVVRVARDRRELDQRADAVVLVGEEVAPEADRARRRPRSGRSAPRTSPSGRPDAARTRSRSRRRSCRRRRAAPRTGRGCSSALARSRRPSAVTTSAASRLSMQRPWRLRSQPMPPREREAGDAGVRDQAAGRREAEGLGRRGRRRPGGAALDPGAAPLRVDPHGAHQRQVEHHAAIADGVARDVVAAAADRHRQAMLARRSGPRR